MPSKRERGKQRKAEKNLAAGNGNDSITQIVAKVRKGDSKTTLLLGDGNTTQSLEESNGILYEQSGILSTVLKFLKRCEDDTFVKVMLDVGGGNLTSPQSWVQVLIKAEVQEPSCRLRIAQNITPLVRCMCNDTKRLFFKSNMHWLDTIQAFAALIHNMILHSVSNFKGKKIIDTLFQYEGLLTSIIQWGFWKEEYRPDIAKKLKSDELDSIVRLGTAILNRLFIATDTQTEEGRNRLEIIGTTPIISKEYDPECTMSLVVGLIRQVKIEGWTTNTSLSLRHLVIWVSCVDKDVITELIGLAMDTGNDKWAAHDAELFRFMVLKRYNNVKWLANDTRTAFAIRSGLIEMCLRFIERFGVSESFDNETDILYLLFSSIKSISLHQKTAKAIRSKKCIIEKELARLEQNAEIINNVNCEKLLVMVGSILDLNGSYCCRCNKSLSRIEVKLCNGCGCMVYCSDVCQKEDWQNGHKLVCCTSCTTETLGRFQGRFEPMAIPVDERAAEKLKELEINMNMIQLKLFLDNSETILSQVEGLGIPLYDCIVVFDLRVYPLEVTIQKSIEYYDTPELMRGFEDSRSKDNITCIFISDIHSGSLIEGNVPTLQMQRLFPCEWLSKIEEKE